MRIRNRLLIKAATWLGVVLLRILYGTCRKTYHSAVPGTNAYKNGDEDPNFYSVWHDQILMVLFCGRPKRAAGLVSKSQDGTYVADVMKMQNIKPVRGSSKHGGAEAVKQLLETAQDHHVTITPDGPRGPRHEMKPGIVFLASKTGRKIVPTAFYCNRCWTIKGSWTDMMIPKPFTRVAIVAGPPLEIPAEASREELTEYAQLLETLMEQCEQQAKRMIHGEALIPKRQQPLPALKPRVPVLK